MFLHVCRFTPHEDFASACDAIVKRWDSDEFGAPKPGDLVKVCALIRQQRREVIEAAQRREYRDEAVKSRRPDAWDAVLLRLEMKAKPTDPHELYWHRRQLLFARVKAGQVEMWEEGHGPKLFNESGKEFDHIPGGLC